MGLNVMVAYCCAQEERGKYWGKSGSRHEVGKGSSGCVLDVSQLLGIFKTLIVLSRYYEMVLLSDNIT